MQVSPKHKLYGRFREPIPGLSDTGDKARVRCSSVVTAFDHGAMGRRIDPSWGGPIELFLVSASAP